jgi:2-hydroxychromene-2-carboxylate isomerase
MVVRGYAVPLAKRLYLVRDAAREARQLGIPFGRICDPLGVGVERCLAVFHHAEQEGQGLAFVSSAGRGIWSEALDMAADEDLALVVRRAGLSWSKARESLSDDSWRDRVEGNRHELRALGLWGVPSFRVGDWACWGQDRLDRVAERVRQMAPPSARLESRSEPSP